MLSQNVLTVRADDAIVWAKVSFFLVLSFVVPRRSCSPELRKFSACGRARSQWRDRATFLTGAAHVRRSRTGAMEFAAGTPNSGFAHQPPESGFVPQPPNSGGLFAGFAKHAPEVPNFGGPFAALAERAPQSLRSERPRLRRARSYTVAARGAAAYACASARPPADAYGAGLPANPDQTGRPDRPRAWRQQVAKAGVPARRRPRRRSGHADHVRRGPVQPCAADGGRGPRIRL